MLKEMEDKEKGLVRVILEGAAQMATGKTEPLLPVQGEEIKKASQKSEQRLEIQPHTFQLSI